jgi:hypothetical protein
MSSFTSLRDPELDLAFLREPSWQALITTVSVSTRTLSFGHSALSTQDTVTYNEVLSRH